MRRGDDPFVLEAGRPGLRGGIVGAVLALATFAVYAQVLNHEFIRLDDRAYVSENPVVLKGLTGEGLVWALTATHASNWHPLTWLSHMLDCELFGADARWHHLTNLLLHCANVWLLFLLLIRTTNNLWPSAFVALLFGIHPLHVESVAWVAERKDVLSTLLGFLTLLAYVRYVHRPAPRRYALVLIALALGLSAKPMLVTWPCVMLLLDYWPLGRFRRRAGAIRTSPREQRTQEGSSVGSPLHSPPAAKLIVEKLPLIALAVLSSIATLYAQRRGGAVVSSALIPLDARVTNALLSYVGYLGMAFWPKGLAIYYPHAYHAAPAWQAAAALLVLCLATAGAVWARRTRPYLLVAWLVYLGTLVPVIGLVQVGTQAMADRYTYVPLTGLFIMLAWGLRDLAQRIRPPRAAAAIAGGAVCGALMTATWVQVGHWRNSVTLFEHALNVTSDNAPVHVFLAQTLFAQDRREEGIKHYREAERLHPDDMDTAYNLGLALYLEGKVEPAIARFSKVVRRRPGHAAAHVYLGSALAQAGRFAEAVPHSTAALSLNHALTRAHFDLGVALAGQGRYEQAVTHFEQWLRVAPDSSDTHFRLGDVYLSLGRPGKAADHYAAGLRVEPDNADARARLARIRTGLEPAD